MCYNNCTYFTFNPVRGVGGCKRKNNPCPEEIETCDKCGENANELFDFQDLYVCEECLEELK